ncbi:MAG TPA: hypothetical protein PLV42_07040 [bacterium]|nr:hypothetical protein [bacterium]
MIVNITINMDHNCIRCGKPGPVMQGDKPGLCLKCVATVMKGSIRGKKARRARLKK